LSSLFGSRIDNQINGLMFLLITALDIVFTHKTNVDDPPVLHISLSDLLHGEILFDNISFLLKEPRIHYSGFGLDFVHNVNVLISTNA
jgi:hypothetical protein